MSTSNPPIDVCFGCGARRRGGDDAPCTRCGEPPFEAVWLSTDPQVPAPVAVILGASAFLLLPAIVYTGLLVACTVKVVHDSDVSSRLTALAIVALLTAFAPTAARWTVRRLFDLWGKRWTYCASDGTRWGSVSSLFGWHGAGEGVCLTALQPTAAGAMPLSSSDAINAGLHVVAAHLSRLQGAQGNDAFAPFDALMLAAFAGLAARGSATISKGRVLRWRRDWLRWTARAAPETAFTIERSRYQDDEGGAVEAQILETLQAMEERMGGRSPSAPPSYRVAPSRPRPVRLLLEDVLRAPLDAAFGALAAPAYGGAPFAVAIAIDDFARRDPDRMAHLCRLLAEHRRRIASSDDAQRAPVIEESPEVFWRIVHEGYNARAMDQIHRVLSEHLRR